jgi:tRNA U55 pseudouridine synthase TruB
VAVKLKKVIVLNKKEGETPLEALEAFRAKNKKYKDMKMTYAGRLDPLVSGLLLVLAGDARKEKEKYLGLTKEYEFSVLCTFRFCHRHLRHPRQSLSYQHTGVCWYDKVGGQNKK